MSVVLMTGMSGTGKSAALGELARRGHLVVDTDYGAYAEDVRGSDAGEQQQLWREDRIEALLDEHHEGVLFISGCVSNQAKFYPRFDAIVLLTAPANAFSSALPVESRTRLARVRLRGIAFLTTWRRLNAYFARVRRPKSTRVRRWKRLRMHLRASRPAAGPVRAQLMKILRARAGGTRPAEQMGSA